MGEAVLDDQLHLLVHQLHALKAGVPQQTYLLLDQQLEGHFGDEEARLGTHRVADGVIDVRGTQTLQGLDSVEGGGEGFVEDEAYACSTGDLVSVDTL